MQRINPYRLFVGVFVPNWLLQREEVSPGGKLLYGKLGQHAGKDGHCYPRQSVLAEGLGVTERQVRNLVTELKGHGLIETEQPGMQRPLAYYFLRHEWMSAPGPTGLPPVDGLQIGAEQQGGQDRQLTSGQEGQSNDAHERQLFSAPYMEEKNQKKRNKGGALRAEEVEAFLSAWNTLPNPIPKIRMMSGGRARALGARLAEPAWKAAWPEALALVPKCPFLMGQNERGWKADVDFFLRPDSVAKILEGKYSGQTAQATAEAEPFWKKHI